MLSSTVPTVPSGRNKTYPPRDTEPAESEGQLGAASLGEGTSVSKMVPSSALLALSRLPLTFDSRQQGGSMGDMENVLGGGLFLFK